MLCVCVSAFVYVCVRAHVCIDLCICVRANGNVNCIYNLLMILCLYYVIGSSLINYLSIYLSNNIPKTVTTITTPGPGGHLHASLV